MQFHISSAPSSCRTSPLLLLRCLLPFFLLTQTCFGAPASESSAWNNPYPPELAASNVLFSSFSEKPNHLDPAQSYSSNEILFTAQIYEPPLQYHFLKRPYELIPLASKEIPKVRYFDENNNELPSDSSAELIAFSEYEVELKKGVLYQPHAAFALDGEEFSYHSLSAEEIEEIEDLSSFQKTGFRELRADDYIYQMKRLAHPGIHSPIFGLMSGYIVGLPELGKELSEVYKQRKGAGEKEPFIDLRDYELSGVKRLDKHRYTIRIRGKYPQFLFWLAMPFFAPVPYEVDRFYSQPGLSEKNISLDWYPVGTGPFMLTVNNPNREMILERNPNFHGERYPSEGEASDKEKGLLADAGKELPLVEKAIYKLEKESIPYWSKFLQGYYDASGVSSESFDQAVGVDLNGDIRLTDGMQAKGIELHTSVGAATFYMGFNMLDPVVGGLSNRARKLRQAISIAIDYEEYISIFRNGRGIAAQGPVPPGIFGYREGEAGINPYVYEWKNGAPSRRTIADARAILEEAGYPDGIDPETKRPLVLYFDVTGSGPDSKAELDWMRKQFRKLGIELTIRSSDYNRFQEKMLNGNAQIFRWGWLADYPDPENFLFLLYGPNSKAVHKGENAANYQSKEFDAVFEKLRSMNNSPERAELVQKAVEIVRRDSPWIFGLHPLDFSLVHSWLKNIKPNQMANNTLKYRGVDAGKRAELQAKWNKPVWWPPALVLGLLLTLLIPAIRGYQRKMRRAAL